MSQTERLMDIWLYIVKNRAFTAGELAEKFDVSSRTIIRDLEHLSVIGVPLYTVQGKGGGYRVLDSVQLPPISFSEAELKSILFAYYMLEQAGDNPFQIEIDSVKEKLLHQMPEYIRNQTAELTQHVDFLYPDRNTAVPELRSIYRASEKQQKLRLTYASAEREETIETFPIGTYTWGGFWYAVGYLTETDKYRIFRLDRVRSIQILENETAPKGMWTLAEWKEHGFDGERIVSVTLEVSAQALRSITNVWMQQGRSKAQKNRQYHLSFQCPERQLLFVVADILKLGSGAKVLEPEEVRKQVRSEIRKMAENYQ